MWTDVGFQVAHTPTPHVSEAPHASDVTYCSCICQDVPGTGFHHVLLLPLLLANAVLDGDCDGVPEPDTVRVGLSDRDAEAVRVIDRDVERLEVRVTDGDLVPERVVDIDGDGDLVLVGVVTGVIVAVAEVRVVELRELDAVAAACVDITARGGEL